MNKFFSNAINAFERLLSTLEGIHEELKFSNKIALHSIMSVPCPNGCRSGSGESKHIVYCGVFTPCTVCGKKIEIVK